MADSRTARRLGGVVLALLFALFAIWSAFRGWDAWMIGERGQAIIAGLAMLGGISLTLRSFRWAFPPRKADLPAGPTST